MAQKDKQPSSARQETEFTMSRGERIADIVRTILVMILSVAIIVAALIFAADKGPQKSIFGYRYYIVITPSMEPNYKVGDIVIVRVTGAKGVKEGDVITFNPGSDGSSYLTHRVTEVLPNYQGTGVTCFHTKGDANEDADGFLLDETRVIGTVKAKIPKLGYVIRFVTLRWYYVVPLLIAFFVMIHLLRLYIESGHEDTEAGEPLEEEKQKEDSSDKEDRSTTVHERDGPGSEEVENQ